MVKYIILVCSILFLSGCTQKLTIKSLNPATIDDMDVKNIALGEFKNDTISLKENIHASMNGVKFHNKQYFTIVNRDATNKILEEQKLQDSGLVINKGEEEYGLSDISSIVMGKITSTNYNTTSYYEKRTNYKRCLEYDAKKRCIRYASTRVICKNHNYSIGASITITKTNNGEILYSKSFAKSFKESICQDSSNSLPSGQTIFEQLSKQIAYEFTKDISPSYSYIEVEVIDDEDIDLTPMEEKMFENSLKLMERKNIKLANELLYKLTQETQNKSASIMYNLAVTYEYLEDLDSANKFYQLAKEITLKDEMDENILKESSRIQKALENKKKAMRQIER